MAGAGKAKVETAVRRRRSPDEARAQALVSARKLLIAHGPNGLTLQAVAQDIGVTHGTLIHHFGSAAALQSALMGAMVRDLAVALESAVAHVRSDARAPRTVVDIVFTAFDEGGAGQLAAWIALSNRYEHLEPVREAVVDLVTALGEKVLTSGDDPPRHIPSALLLITLCAFGDAVIGGPLREMLGRDRDAVRRLAANLLPALIE
ncbi:TetR/AcrR family transcriptional regulator [Caulobacter sp. Root1472]|jgi:AcrR family transcriptional regulator|uniref:TetR/AcrR family transcriptional regulator n=1 Tax=Caulobacter sp. Root1472 TaxID=1736470 RepID=UPI00070225B9|nr:TetR/AcrR family transcriptional regulator [Caulobacter sp. Root1472]KQZ27913.1 TetR family transcriptional regulator [Caulobacter sp. Root1472]